MKPLANDPVIVSAYRSPIAKLGGALSALRSDDMLAFMLQQLIKRSALDPLAIDEVVIGCANQAGEDNRNIARMAVLLAGLPESIPAITLNRLCASGLDAVIDGARRIITGEAELVLAGGVESMTRAPYVMAKPATGFRLGAPEIFDTSLGWRFFNDKMSERTPEESNGMTAERLAKLHNISRLRQDEFALESHKRAIAAQNEGFFKDEIIPITVSKNQSLVEVSHDEGPRADTSLEKLSALKPAFLKDGTVTAGNSSSLNDGAAILAITSHAYAKAHDLKPKARIVGFAAAGVDPKLMGMGPVPATEKLLHSCRLLVSDFSAVEINEAFAAQVLYAVDALNLDLERVNQRGGAISLGHPLGSSGARIVATLVNRLQKSQAHLGLASLCVGVGQGVSMAIEAL